MRDPAHHLLGLDFASPTASMGAPGEHLLPMGEALVSASASTALRGGFMEMLESEFIRQSVKRGAALMDEKDPHWFEKINLESLDMKNPCLCVLGQVYGRYAYGLAKVLPKEDYQLWVSGESDSGVEPYGFCLDEYVLDDSIIDSYQNLDRLWTQEIKNRYERGVNIDG